MKWLILILAIFSFSCLDFKDGKVAPISPSMIQWDIYKEFEYQDSLIVKQNEILTRIAIAIEKSNKTETLMIHVK